ncbi:branched-chain amino acid ABC transporter permease [Vulcanimicrobium alpinum]|uniref:Branched-chain amino acid ABC transporter permease n=1 Tax=Vulcanimicrobium alpinum TaxID=3016050 RepID=A0AAN1XXH4_UNVUL|nr:branched-chain amino acid ABC transporter permease [Vulcanimicrobium alpinum]BDE06744.1 branched-chain amino acid ABC transporter permease [Vulcanimicrobium alpinum]
MSRKTLGVGLVIVAVALVPLVVRSDYVLNVMGLAGIYAIAVMGLGILLGFTGQMSLAQAAFFGIGAYTSGWITTHLGWPVWGAMALAVVMSALIGLVVGYPCLRLSGHYLALATIGFGIITQLVLINWKDVTNGSDGMTGIPPPQIGGFVFDTYGRYYYVVLVAVIFCAYVAWRIKTTRVGRALEAIRENEIAARATGIDATRYKITAFVLAGAYAGLAGSLLAHDIKFISPDSYSFDQSVVFLVMLILGGSSSITGAILGAVLLTVLPEVLRPLKSSYIMVYGAAVIAMIVFMPRGLVGLLEAARRRTARRGPPPLGAPAPAPEAA